MIGHTALHSAVQVGWSNRQNITRMLIENGADLNVVGKDGSTPLDLAIIGNQFECDIEFH